MKCQCGEILDEACSNEAETSIRFVPEWQRGTAVAAGSARGMWKQICVSDFCADLLCDGEWIEEVGNG